MQTTLSYSTFTFLQEEMELCLDSGIALNVGPGSLFKCIPPLVNSRKGFLFWINSYGKIKQALILNLRGLCDKECVHYSFFVYT